MPRYYFTLEQRGRTPVQAAENFADDAEELADDDAARAVAEQLARDLVKNNNKRRRSCRVVVRNAAHEAVCEIALKGIRKF
jgi:hypothetical protein